MIRHIIPSTTSPAMKSPCFKVKSISYEMKINENNNNSSNGNNNKQLLSAEGIIQLIIS